MKLLVSAVVLSMVTFGAWGQQEGISAGEPKDPQALVTAVYNVISGPAGQQRDWNRFRSLYAPGAHLTIVGKDKDGKVTAHVITPEEYAERAGASTPKTAWYEREIASRTERFGNLVHVWSTYKGGEDPAKLDERGINSFEIMCTERCWVLSVTWADESPENPIPKEYLKN